MRNGGVRLVVAGRTRNKAVARIRFTTPDGKTATAPIGTSGFFITDITSKKQLFTGLLPNSVCHWTSTFVLLDGSGRQLTHKTLTFGPRICLHRPNPIITTKAGTKTFILSRGADGYLTEARPGDNVVCRGSGQSVTMAIPRAPVHGHVRRNIRPFPLVIHIDHRRSGRIWVMCS
jgi:hypothetical protein